MCSTAKLNQTIPKWNNGFGRRTEFNGRNLLKWEIGHFSNERKREKRRTQLDIRTFLNIKQPKLNRFHISQTNRCWKDSITKQTYTTSLKVEATQFCKLLYNLVFSARQYKDKFKNTRQKTFFKCWNFRTLFFQLWNRSFCQILSF